MQTHDVPREKKPFARIVSIGMELNEAILGNTSYSNYSSLEKKTQYQSLVWNEYIYPEFKEIFFEQFPSEKYELGKISEYNEKMIIIMCEWLNRKGFVHHFRGDVLLITPILTDFGDILISGIPVKRLSPSIAAHCLNELSHKYIIEKKRTAYLLVALIVVSILTMILLNVALS